MNATATATSEYVTKRHNKLNASVFRVTPQADGMELVEYVGHVGYNVPDDVQALVVAAQGMATATGSRSASYTDGTGTRMTYYANAYAAPRLTLGVHRAVATLSADQAALRTELAAQQGVPTTGQRWVVSQLSGYLLVQNRPLDHRACHCGDGVTTYYAGTVESVTHYMDNSVEATVRLDDGRVVTDMLVAPHGDACY